VIFAPGDGTVLSEAISVLCRDWRTAGKDIECIDMKSGKSSHDHGKLMVTDDSRSIILEWLIGNETLKSSNRDL
jgi:hypothetical protein